MLYFTLPGVAPATRQETELAHYVTHTGRSYGASSENYYAVLYHARVINTNIQRYAGEYAERSDLGNFRWKPETLAYFYATITVESRFGTDMIGDPNEPGVGQYYGRGYIQLTHDYNYASMGGNFSVDLLNKPDLAATDLNLSARIAMRCMIIRGTCGGGTNLEDYSRPDGSYDYVGARNIINPGSPSAPETALIAQDILSIVQRYWSFLGLP